MPKEPQTITKYGARWGIVEDPVNIERACIKRGGQWKLGNGTIAGAGLFFHYKRLQELIWPEDSHHRWSDLMLSEILANRITAIMGSKDCIAGHTKLLDPITGQEHTIQELCDTQTAPMVMTLEGPIQACIPFEKGEAELYEIICTNGSRFTATAKHAVLGEQGFVFCEALQIGQCLVSYSQAQKESSAAPSRSTPLSDAKHCSNIIPNLKDDYSAYPYPYGGQLHSGSDNDQDVFPSLSGVLKHGYCFERMGGRGNSATHNRLYPQFSRLSILDSLSLSRHAKISIPTFREPEIYESGVDWCLHALRCGRAASARIASVESVYDARYTPSDERELPCKDFKVQWTQVQAIIPRGIGKFYDLHVPLANHYFSEGCLHSNSGKTHCALSKFGLTDYFCFPQNTLILISSTDIRGLELRVWGDLKTMFMKAKARYPWLPGHLLDSKHAIATDNLKEDFNRDMRKGVVCFPKGTLVDTPSGAVPIETIKVGDSVFNACGVGRVKGTHSSPAKRLVRVRLSDGREIDCTDEHPFLTHQGWINAVDLQTFDRVFSVYETMRLMQEVPRPRLSKSKVLLKTVPRIFANEIMRRVRKLVSSVEASIGECLNWSILQYSLCGKVGGATYRMPKTHNAEMQKLRKEHALGSSQSGFLFSNVSKSSTANALRLLWKSLHFNSASYDSETNSFLQSVLQMERDATSTTQERSYTDTRGIVSVENVSEGNLELSPTNRTQAEGWSRSLVQNRRGISQIKTCSRNRWWSSPHSDGAKEGCKTHSNFTGAWVESVTVLESSGDKRFSASAGGYIVHNLAVEGHPSYSVNGVVVHNCIPCMSSGGSWMGLGKYVGIKQVRRRLFGDELQFMKPSYIESLANLNSGDFKGVFVGNPLGEGDPLDKLSEPKDGWGTEGDVTKTTVWENKFIGGKTINLVGTDSPNFDHSQDPTPKYPWMINRHSIEAVVAFYGMDSLQYYSQCLGIRRPGLNARRVISKMMCKKFHALEPAVWLNTKQTRIYAVDAAYGGLGGDRCIGIRIDFGFDVTGKSIIKVFPCDLIPVSVKDDIRLPEDQIADWVKKKCEDDNIPATNVFFDSTGRGSLGTSFARLWSAYVNPVEFGGRPTERPVSTSLKVRDLETGQMRLKLCSEHYSKFVTELWYSIRYVIEAGQMRELPEDVMDEGCRREWKMVKGDKIEIETKEDMKERVNISPDLFDALATAIEGARRMGFVINSLDTGKAKQDDDSWKKILKDRAEKLTHGKALSYA